MLYCIFYVLLAHLIADFYLQSDYMVKAKSFSKGKTIGVSCHLLHLVIHVVILTGMVCFWAWISNVSIKSEKFIFLEAVLIVCLTHLLTDLIKSLMPSRNATVDFWFFILDQVIHISMLVWMVYGYFQQALFIPRPPAPEPDKVWFADVILLFCGLLFLLKPASIIVMNFLSMAMADTKRDHINMTKSHLGEIFYQSIKERLGKLLSQDGHRTAPQVDRVLNETQKNNKLVASRLKLHDSGTNVSENFPSNRAGKWIGYTERTMIFLFFLSGQYTAIAAVMALKTAFRFNDLKDDNDSHRSEYIMIGTFVSFFITIATAALVRHVLISHHFGQVTSALLKNVI